MMQKSIITLGVFLVVVFSLSLSFAEAKLINGCINQKSKMFRIVNSESECRQQELPITWNQIGPAGADGTDGINGLNGLSCWDLNDNEACDSTEDVDNSGVCDAADCQGKMVLTPQPLPPINPALGEMYYHDSEAICVYMSAGWVKIVGDGNCPNCSTDVRFCDNMDGTVTDTTTGLMWAASSSTNSRPTWQQAVNYCNSYTGGGNTDWRMPTITELVELYLAGVRYQNNHEFIKIEDFLIWSGNTRPNPPYDDSAAWVSFYDGRTVWNTIHYYGDADALPVRDTN